ncbi:MAG: hypothetical protein GX051_00180 [Clostridiales bacterium]|nr:hypothetical protein [Clostridiales bacterium]
MKIISDIRLYKSNVENIDGNSLPSGFDDNASIAVHRVLMKLQENGFSLGNYTHLYLNLTTCAVDGGIKPSKRSVDSYHPWYRYYDVQISEELFEKLGKTQMTSEILDIVKKVLIECFCQTSVDKQLIIDCFEIAVSQGELMTMKFKETRTKNRTALIYLRYGDDLLYHPVLKIYDSNNSLLFESELPETSDLGNLGSIQLSSRKITIKPRTASYYKSLQPITYSY